MTTETATKTEIAVIPQDIFNRVSLNAVESIPETFKDMSKLLHSMGVEIDVAENVLADEWPEIDKEDLINVPILLVSWSVSNPETSENGQYLTIRGITESNRRFRFADGSTGIMAQLVKLTKERFNANHPTPNAGLFAPKGLRKSEYETVIDGKKQKAKTFYVSNAPVV